MDAQTSIEMPKYKSHKEIHALKIGSFSGKEDGTLTISPANPRYSEITVSHDDAVRFERMTPADLGYYVVYKDGYISWSPSEAFEDGYTLI